MSMKVLSWVVAVVGGDEEEKDSKEEESGGGDDDAGGDGDDVDGSGDEAVGVRVFSVAVGREARERFKWPQFEGACVIPGAGEKIEDDNEVSVAEWEETIDWDGEGEDEVEGIDVADADEDEDEEVGEVENRFALYCSTCCQARKVSTWAADWDCFVWVVAIELLSVARGRTTAVAWEGVGEERGSASDDWEEDGWLESCE
jgi:hypothetical protein